MTKTILYSLLAIEFLSLFSWCYPNLMSISFFIIIFLALILSFKKLEYGLLIIFSELIIGSLGYLFWLEVGEIKISIRIALWAVVMGVWLMKFIKSGEILQLRLRFAQNDTVKYFYILFIFIIFAVINGFLQNNILKNIFFDFNGWLFFTLLFPVISVYNKKNKKLKLLKQVLLVSIIWIAVKSLIILFIFSHNLSFAPEIYRWIRDTRIGEITMMENGFVRVFFQSHIYIIPAFFIAFLSLKNKKNYYFLLILFFSIILLGFSRSNWVGFAFGLLVLFLYLIIKKKYLFKYLFKSFLIIVASGLFSLLFIALIINFPLPRSTNNLNTISLIADRASQINSEAGVSSRWKLLPVLWQEIKKAPILGQGFGATVTYISDDPRVRENSPDGEYTTFAFEWGWLDIWLKLGIFGLITYLLLIFIVIRNWYYSNLNNNLITGLIIGLLSLVIISFFSPYMNHPLGIGYLALISVLINYKICASTSC